MAERTSKPGSSLPRRGLGGSGTDSASTGTTGTTGTASEQARVDPKAPQTSKTAKTAKTAKPSKTGDASSAETTKTPLVDRAKAMLSNATDNMADARTAPTRGAAPSKASTNKVPTRRARLRLTRIDPWSVAKTAFLLSIALGIVTVVAVALVWGVLSAAGVWDSINAMVYQVIGTDSGTNFDVENYLGTSRVMGFTMVVAGIDVLLLTAIATLGAFLYNLAAALLGGIEVTLAEDGR